MDYLDEYEGMLIEIIDPPIGERLDILLHRINQSLHQQTVPYIEWGKSLIDKYQTPDDRRKEIDAVIAREVARHPRPMPKSQLNKPATLSVTKPTACQINQ